MIVLNLLPSSDRKKTAKHYLVLFVKDIILAILWLSTVVAVFFIICYFFLNADFTKTNQSAPLVIKGDKITSQEIQQINEDLKNIAEIQEQNTNWTKLLLVLNNLIPIDNIQITHLEINKTKNLIVLQGKALTRDSFLILKENLEKSGMFSNIESPLSNLLLAKNLNFRLEMEFAQPDDSTH